MIFQNQYEKLTKSTIIDSPLFVLKFRISKSLFNDKDVGKGKKEKNNETPNTQAKSLIFLYSLSLSILLNTYFV